jgi:hypothetical protein
MSEITGNEDDNFHYKRLCNDVFEISSQAEMYEKSRIRHLQAEIDNLLKKEKIDILVNKSVNEIRAKIDCRLVELDKDIYALKEKLNTLSLNPEELEGKQRDCEHARKRVQRGIDGMESDLKEFVSEKIKNALRSLEKKRNAAIGSIEQCVNSAKTAKEATPRVNHAIRDIPDGFKDVYEDVCRVVKAELKTKSHETISDMEEIITRFSDGDEEKSKDYINACRTELREKSENLSMADIFSGQFDGKGSFNFGSFLGGFLSVVTLGIAARALSGRLSWDMGGKKETLAKAKGLLPSDEVIRDSFAPLNELTDYFVGFLRGRFETDLINVIQTQIEEAQREFASREQNKQAAEKELAQAEVLKKAFKEKADEANAILKTVASLQEKG